LEVVFDDMPKQDPVIEELQEQQAALDNRFSTELQKLRDDINREIKASLDLHSQTWKTTLDNALGPLRQDLEKNAANEIDLSPLNKQIKELREEQIELLNALDDSVNSRLHDAKAELLGNDEDADARSGELRTIRQLAIKSEELVAGIEGSHNLLSGQISDALASFAVKDQVAELEARLNKSLEGEVLERKRSKEVEFDPCKRELESMRSDIQDLSQKLEQIKSSTAKATLELGGSFETEIRRVEDSLRVHHDEASAGHTSDTTAITAITAQVAGYDADIKALRDIVGRMSLENENMYTRSVTWRIRGFRHKLYGLLQTSRGVLTSPPFSVYAQSAMVMEMLAAPEEQLNVSMPIPPIPTAGACSMRIWAAPGYHLAFKLIMGESSPSISRRFEHKFQAGELTDATGRACFQIKNICQLDDIWVKSSNTVTVTLEVLEMRYTVQPPPSLDPEEPVFITPGMSEEEKDAALADVVAEQGKEYPDEISTSRVLVSDHVMQERLKGELQVLRNRTVRRVEWRLDGVTRLLDTIKPGEAVDSALFSAAGIDKMQIHFYPRGCEVGDKVSAHAQACAIYVSGPHRTTLRGILTVGSHSRPFEQRYQRRGDVGGRGRFCTLASQLDCEDSVTLAIDITEVESDLPEATSTLLSRRVANPGSESPGSPVGGVKATLRMKREDPAKNEELVRCISLPALNNRDKFLPKVEGASGTVRKGQRSR
jgi:hypothetical protein